MRLTLISGLSGSGKSVALRRLEDAGYYCVDNLPATMLGEVMALYRDFGYQRIAISVDIRSSPSLNLLPKKVTELIEMGVDLQLIFLDANDKTLVKRFSETRRRHPLAIEGRTLEEAITLERKLLAGVQEIGHRIDTSELTASTLRRFITQLIESDTAITDTLSLTFESFGFKYGVPLDADFVYDVRCLPNPYYDLELRPLSGLDQPVMDYFMSLPEVSEMITDIRQFISKWLPAFVYENRSYLTVAIGCTGGQHRSVYVAEQLAKFFHDRNALVRHRQLSRRADC